MSVGSLYRNDLNKFKTWFSQAAKLLGVDISYRYIIERNKENTTGETVYSKYSQPIKQSVIVESGPPKVDTLKQLGWFTDTKEEQLLVSFAVNTPNLQSGCRFKFISNENDEQSKEYEIVKMSNEQTYPSCIKCLCIPILKNESTYVDKNNIHYGQQDIISDEENYSYINSEPKKTVF